MSHDHHHHSSGKNLRLAFILNLSFTIIEIIGGFLSNSIAILSDAVHDLGDSISLGLAWYLDKKSKKHPDQKYTFGYARFSLLGALINSIVLIIGTLFVAREAIERILHPEVADPDSMIGFAILGVTINGYAAWKVNKGQSLNEKVVSWHLLEDVLGWVAVLIAAIVLKFKYIPWLDPALSIAIMLYILFGVAKRLRETIHLFLQGVPRNMDVERIKKEIHAVDGIASTHHMHVWSLEGEHHVFSSHLKLKGNLNLEEILVVKQKVKHILKQKGFKHYTLEIETEDEKCDFETSLEKHL